MNYCEIDDFFTSPKDLILNDKDEKLINTDNSARDILKEYECLKNNLNEFKNEYKELNKQKDVYDEYLNNLLNRHMNIINIINNFENLNINDTNDTNNNINDSFNNYKNKIKENYDKWILNYYIKKIKTIENNIDIIENKLKDFTNLFVFIINDVVGDKEISKNMCPICFENPVDICFNPCGHTSCNSCVISSRISAYGLINKCYTCRSPITDYLKIYFSL